MANGNGRNQRGSQETVNSFSGQSSALSFYSLGIAANNKEVGSKTLMVLPIEVLTLIDGEIASEPFNEKAQGVDADGNTYQTSVTGDRAIPCTWFPMANSNRRTAPDVRRGERVLIYQFADRNEYVWQSLGMDDHLRKLETVTFSISGTAEEPIDGTLPENAYILEMSSHKGLVTLRTSQKNGEKSVYTVQINAKEGTIAAGDNEGNYIRLDTANTEVEMVNGDNTLIRITKKEILLQGKKATVDVDDFIVTGKSQFADMMQANGIISPRPIKGPIGEI